MKRVLSFLNEDELILDVLWKQMSVRKVTFQQTELPNESSVLTKMLHKHMTLMLADTQSKEEIENRFKKSRNG